MKATPAMSVDPAEASSPTRTTSSKGRLSMTNQPKSSSAAETVERPAPDMPVTSTTSLIAHTCLRGPRTRRRLQMIVEPLGDVIGQPRQGVELIEGGLAQRVQ